MNRLISCENKWVGEVSAGFGSWVMCIRCGSWFGCGLGAWVWGFGFWVGSGGLSLGPVWAPGFGILGFGVGLGAGVWVRSVSLGLGCRGRGGFWCPGLAFCLE